MELCVQGQSTFQEMTCSQAHNGTAHMVLLQHLKRLANFYIANGHHYAQNIKIYFGSCLYGEKGPY